MCVIIHKPIGQILKKSIMHKCWKHNSHGGGFAYAVNNQIFIHKELKNFEKFYTLYKENVIDKNIEKDINILMHMRIKTHGLIDYKNIHPFFIDGNMAFAHNGVITSVTVEKDSNKSDTMVFKDTILNKLPNKWIENDTIVELIESYIGIGSKLAIINRKGEIKLFNKEKFIEKDKILYSNKHWDSYEYISSYCYGGSRGYTSGNFGRSYNKDRWKSKYSKEPIVPIKDWKPTIPMENIKTRFKEDNVFDKSEISNIEFQDVVCLNCKLSLYTLNERRANICNYCLETIKETINNGNI